MVWVPHVTPEGTTYYYNSATGETQWNKPEELGRGKEQSVIGLDVMPSFDTPRMRGSVATTTRAPARRPAQQQYSIAVDPANVQVVSSPGGNRATDLEDDFKPIGTGSIREKIRVALGGLPSFVRCCCANMVTALDQKNGNECCMKVHPLRNLGGAMLYGFLFPPFIFALLQQSMIDKTAIDPFAPVGSPSGGAWVSGSIFLTSVMLFCLFGFTVLPGPQWYTPGSGRLAILLFAVLSIIDCCSSAKIKGGKRKP